MCVMPHYTIPFKNHQKRAGVEPVKNYLQIIVLRTGFEPAMTSLKDWWLNQFANRSVLLLKSQYSVFYDTFYRHSSKIDTKITV